MGASEHRRFNHGFYGGRGWGNHVFRATSMAELLARTGCLSHTGLRLGWLVNVKQTNRQRKRIANGPSLSVPPGVIPVRRGPLVCYRACPVRGGILQASGP